MESKKTGQRGVVHGEPPPKPGDQARAEIREGGEKVGNDGGASEAYLAPGQHVTEERRRYHEEEK